MVIQGYGINLFEQDEMEARDFHERWQAEKARVVSTVPDSLDLELRTIFKSF